MRTIIFSTKEEAEPIQKLLGGEIIEYILKPCGSAIGIIDYLDKNEDAIAIIVGNALVMGWSTPHVTNVLFSSNYPTHERIRSQALGRVRFVI